MASSTKTITVPYNDLGVSDYTWTTCYYSTTPKFWVDVLYGTSSGQYSQTINIDVDVDDWMSDYVSDFSYYYDYSVNITFTAKIGWISDSSDKCYYTVNTGYASTLYGSYVGINGDNREFSYGTTEISYSKDIGTSSRVSINCVLDYAPGSVGYGYYALVVDNIKATITYEPKCSITNISTNAQYNYTTGAVSVDPSYSSYRCFEVSHETYYNTTGSLYSGSVVYGTHYPSHKTEYFYTVVSTLAGTFRQSSIERITVSGDITLAYTPNCNNIVAVAELNNCMTNNPHAIIRYRIKESGGSYGSWVASGTFSGTQGVSYVVEAALFLDGDTINDDNRIAYKTISCYVSELGWSQDLTVHVGDSQAAVSFSIPKPLEVTLSATNTCSYPITYQYREPGSDTWTSLASNVLVPTIIGTYYIRAYVNGYDLESTVYTCELVQPTFTVSVYSEDTGIDTGYEVSPDDNVNVFESDVNRVIVSHASSWDGQEYVTGTKTCEINNTSTWSVYVVNATLYAVTTTYTIAGVENSISFTITGRAFTDGTIMFEDIDLFETSSAIERTAGESLVLIAQNWGSGSNTYEFVAYQTGLDGTNPVTLSPDNGVLNGTGVASTKILIPYSTEYGYKVSIKVSSIDDIGRSRSTDGHRMCTAWFTCTVGIVPSVVLLPDPHVGGVNTEFSGDASKSFVRGYDFTLSYRWDLYQNGTIVNENLSTEELTNATILTKITAIGDYYLRCTISGTYVDNGVSTALDSVYVDTLVSIKDIIQTGINDFNRFAIVVSDKSVQKCFVLTRTSAPYFTNLTFEKSLSNVGSLSCRITGLNSEQAALFNSPGAYVTLLDRMNPVWSGVVSEANKVNTNVYNKSIPILQYDMVCYEATKVLALEYIPNNDKGLLSGTITEVAQSIIPTKYHGSIGTSSVNYGISLSNTSRLTALDQLYNQAGWRYRCRPNTLSFWQDYSADTVLSGYSDTAIAVYYADNKYSCGYANGFTKTTDGKVSIYDEFLIDFRPSYYQTYDTRDFVVNYDAKNVSEIENIRDKFGTAIVYGVGYSGESIASSMKAWMPINKDYTIDNSMRITTSYDAEIDSVIKQDDILINGVKYSRYIITMNGWSFPDMATLTRLKSNNILPRIYFVNSSNKLHYVELEYDDDAVDSSAPDVNPRRYYDQANNKKCAYTVCISANKMANDNTTKVSSVIESLVPLSNIIFPVFAVDYPMSLPDVGDEICVGDMVCVIAQKNNTYNEVVVNYKVSPDDWQANGIPHGHLTDVLVMDNSGEYNQSNPHPDSPYKLYPNTSLTTQGPEGYTIMEMERLACRYMQYGSNYSAEGTANVSALFFNREDYEVGTARIPMVGDRIGIKTMNDAGEWVVNQFELQRYVFNHDSYSVEMTYGMPILNIGEIIYNMMSNAGMSIIPADS